VIGKALDRAKVPEDERLSRIAEILGRAGFTDLDAEAATLSGGWRKRLAIVEALVQRPDILLLDEPTNHLDLAGIQWLEEDIAECPVRVRGGEPRPLFPRECGERDGGNSTPPTDDGALAGLRELQHVFLEAKEQYLHAQRNRQAALENRRGIRKSSGCGGGPKARTTKIEGAH